MPNKISQALLEGAANEEVVLKRFPHDDQIAESIREAREWAERIDRLVQAAHRLCHAVTVGWTEIEVKACVKELTAALRDIELESEEEKE